MQHTEDAPAPGSPTLTDTHPAPTADAYPTTTDGPVERPVGITLLGVLYGLFAAIMLIGGVLLLVGGGVLASVLLAMLPGFGKLGSLGGVLFMIFGLVVAAFGALALLVTLGLFKGAGWAWTTALILAAISGVNNLLGLLDGEASALIGLAIAGLIIWYLFEPAPKTFFGKAHVKAFWQKEKGPTA